jgi:hypothetical protein
LSKTIRFYRQRLKDFSFTVDADIAATVALEGGYNACDNSTGFGTKKRRKRETSTGRYNKVAQAST